ncbi:hypothetical protein Pan44_09050 [Caulifigura coniformis]|uniref:DUF1579 domain-containing protein n=1 Tax=Caulifigura coniformis TaxID=2527983 RepID=A0A517S9V2_9PLAN|nr:DUF1579 family protein [Caulifigura coniformis]QDT52892.1 hypothetical protein Pan44_09050 [Caulifigura coniformis]
MNRFICRLAACVAVVLVAGGSFAQDFPKPGKEHQDLAKAVGKWKLTVKEGFNAGQTGTSEFKAVCNGMWVASDFKMDDGSFTGQGLDSYDPTKKKYVSVWVDSMSATPLFFEGDWTEPGKTMVMTAKGPGPDGTPVEYRSVTKHPSEKAMTFELYMKSGGAEVKLMVVEYAKM